MSHWTHCPARTFLATFAASSLGEWLTITGMSALVYGLGGLEAVGLYHTLRFLPAFVVSPLAGALGDRVGLERMVRLGELLQATCYLLLLLVCGDPELLLRGCYAAAVVTEVARSSSRPALLALVPAAAPEGGLAALNTARSVIYNVAFTAGPVAAGLLIATGSPASLLAALAAAYLLSSLSATRLPASARASEAPRGWRASLAQAAAGGRRLATDPLLRRLTAAYLGCLVIIGGSQVFVAELCGGVLGLDESWVAGMFGVVGVGAVAGSLLGGALAKTWLPRMVIVTGCVAAFGFSVVLCGLASGVAGALCAMLVMGVAGTSCEPVVWTLFHERAPEGESGSLFGALGVVVNGGFLLGTTLTTALLSWGGYELGVAALGLGVVVSAGLLALSAPAEVEHGAPALQS
jgi:predicted MFS family arabinose efflux permease